MSSVRGEPGELPEPLKERERIPQPAQTHPKRRLFLAELLALLVFAGLGLAASHEAYFAFDPSISRWLQLFREPALLEAMRIVSLFGFFVPATVLMVFAVALLLTFRFRVEALFLLLTLVGDGIGQVIKIVVNRPRPDASLVEVLQGEVGKSFPSAHTLHYVLFFGCLFYFVSTLLRPSPARLALQLLLALPIVLIGLSRVYLGDHWASDVLGGYLLGGLLLSLHLQLYRWFKQTWELVPHAPFVRRRPLPVPV